MRCSVLQCVAVRVMISDTCLQLRIDIDVLQRVAECSMMLWTRYSAVCCSVLQCAAVCCSVLQCVAVSCSVLQCAAVCCSVLQCVVVCCSVLQCVAGMRYAECVKRDPCICKETYGKDLQTLSRI